MRRWGYLAAVLFLALWLAVVIASGAGWSPFQVDWNYENTGAFGDSFGPINVAIASAAALSAIAAFRAQQREVVRLRQREAEEDERRARERRQQDDRDSRRDALSNKENFERTFFNLLTAFNELVAQTDIALQAGKVNSARDAFRSIVRIYENGLHTGAGIEEVWSRTFSKYQNDLGHYFRFMYHVVKFVDESDIENKYFYVRLLRAMLSEAELVLLALNCSVGEGREKFKSLAEKYALLHNISDKAKHKYDLEAKFETSAFGQH